MSNRHNQRQQAADPTKVVVTETKDQTTTAVTDNVSIELPKVDPVPVPEAEVINQATLAEMTEAIKLPEMEQPPVITRDLFGVEPSRNCKSMMGVLDAYIDQMHSSKFCPANVISSQQCALSNLYRAWLTTDEVTDFLQFGDYLLAKVSELRASVFDPTLINRGFDNIPLPLKDRTAMALVNALIYNVTNEDRKLGYVQCGAYEGSLIKHYGNDPALRLSLYLKRYCGLN
jgi:hypothetical protein